MGTLAPDRRGVVMRLHCSFVTAATPEQVIDAYTDSSARRLDVWRDTLSPDRYALLDSGPGWAVVREGSPGSAAVLRYAWGEPGLVTWTLVESTFCRAGAGRLEVRPAGSGSRVEIRVEEHGPAGAAGWVVLALKGLLGPAVLRRTARRTLDRLATGPAAA